MSNLSTLKLARVKVTNLLIISSSFGVRSFAEADHADCGQLDDVLGQRHELQNVPELFPLEGPVQGGHDHRLALVGHLN